MYKLEHPYTEEERINFIVEYNHKQGLKIETVDNFIEVVVDEEKGLATKKNHPTYYALEANEIIVDGEVVIDLEYEEKQAQAQKERIAKLYLTGADVERGIYKARGMDFEDILAFVSANPPEGLDIKALKIELKANNFYRGNPYVSAIGSLLGFSEEQLDRFFEDGNYEHLLPKEEPMEDDPQENQDTSENEPTNVPNLTQEE